MLRGIRGAATVKKNSKEEIWLTAQKLVKEILSMNEIEIENVGAVIFSSTKDLTAGFPTTGLRQTEDFKFIPLFDALEPDIENSLSMCIRVLILAETEKNLKDICHVYLGGAKNLRPDLSDKNKENF